MKDLKVTPIKNGTVIDHIKKGMALKVLRILKVTGAEEYTISVALNVASKASGKKDIVKIEDREIQPHELDKIALIAPNATINIIRDYKVVKKHKVKLPDTIAGVVRCANPNCVAVMDKRLVHSSIVFSKNPVRIKCFFCEREIDDISENIII
jgi:aspartate carbamoyltransferase regulatory subunit